METISSAASAASKAIWGDSAAKSTQSESGQEPVSGETGNTEIGEPYDAGNIEVTTRPAAYIHCNTDEPDSAQDVGPVNIEHSSEREVGVFTGQAGSSNDSFRSGVIPSVGKDSSSGQQSSINYQVEDRPIQEPTPGFSEHDEMHKSDVSGPGPKAPSKTSAPQAITKSIGTNGEDGPQKESTDEGSGEKWVKSTQLPANGDDIDAGATGAGREADRLMDHKGIQPSAEPSSGDQDPNPSNYKSDKRSLKERIKAKLHRDKGAQ